ncbi:MAG: hypothetical protein HY938_11830 [Nitrosomonadales bacterium]|nr:hypothetical protein [Nitrosomonadales bacterium]
MGIIFNNAALLIKAKQNHVCFDKVLTLGHLELYLSREQIGQLASHCGKNIDVASFSGEKYADKFIREFFDTETTTSLDYSDYQNCDIVHDMNLPIDSAHHEQFDVVIDGGTLEHIFNFPVAIENCMKMVKNGGSIFIFTMTNNHSGHGFYQFSPELFFRIFQKENGFEIRDVILEEHPFPGAELSNKTKCYSVTDPAVVHRRVGLVSRTPVMMMVHAVKTETRPVFSRYPIQSDYLLEYDKNAANKNANNAVMGSMGKTAQNLLNLLPVHLRNLIVGKRQLWRYSFSNKSFYKRWHPF